MDTITTEIYQRIILGTAIGDSMGLPAENLSSKAVHRRWKGRWKQQFLFRYGLVTDDTEHTVWGARECRKLSFFPWFTVPFRNLFFFLLVLIHIFRRLLPF